MPKTPSAASPRCCSSTPEGAAQQPTGFRMTYINSKYIFTPLLLLGVGCLIQFEPEFVSQFLSWVDPTHPEFTTWQVLQEKIPLTVFSLGMIVLSYFSVTRNLSLIPVLGLSSCGYLMTELGITNWIRFGIWLILGVIVYRAYGFKNSKLNRRLRATGGQAASPEKSLISEQNSHLSP